MLPSRDSLSSRIIAAVRAHERLLAIACLAGVALITAALFVAPFQRVFLSQVERVADYVDNRWTRQLREGERLVEEERFEEAATYLETLALRFPARSARHSRSPEMQRLLSLLGRSHQALGRKTRTLSAYRRAALHDPRNYSNHFQLAQAALAFDESEEARQGFEQALAINPAHIPSVEGLIQIATDGEDPRGVVEAYERYLDAMAVRDLELGFGDRTALVPVIADGRFRTTEVWVRVPEGWSGELTLSVNEFVPELRRIELHPPLSVGEPGAPAVDLPVEGHLQRSSSTERNPPVDSYRLVLRVPPQPRGVARTVMRLRLLKPVRADVWRMIEGAYATVLDPSGAAAARDRSHVREAGE